MSHIKGPWSFAPVVHDGNYLVGLFGPEPGRIATLIDGPNSREQTIETAAHIVRCVNSHETLMEALIQLSTLGGGRSEGNRIAQKAIKKVQP